MKGPKQIILGTLCVAVTVACLLRIIGQRKEIHRDLGQGRLPTVQLPLQLTCEFTPHQVGPPFPAIATPAHIPASEVTDEVGDSELILGVVVAGEARAYPINMLTGPQREIINDHLGGRAIAATW